MGPSYFSGLSCKLNMKMGCVQIEFNDQLKACAFPVQKGMDKKKHENLLK